jgi:hypothetical protein
VLDEFTHEWLAIRVARKLKAIDVIDGLSDLILRQPRSHPPWALMCCRTGPLQAKRFETTKTHRPEVERFIAVTHRFSFGVVECRSQGSEDADELVQGSVVQTSPRPPCVLTR